MCRSAAPHVWPLIRLDAAGGPVVTREYRRPQ